MNIGIDFGTTNSIISFYNELNIEILEINKNKLIPSKILITDDKIFYGLDIPKTYNNGLLIQNLKKHILNNYIIEFNEKKYNLDNLIKEYLKYLINLIKTNLISENYNCVISVPNNFDDSKKKFIKHTIEKENINIIRIINEATSAAISHSLDINNDYEKLLVIDIGGGTTDLTILEKDDNLFEIIESIGDSNLGGNDFTNVIINDIKNNLLDINTTIEWEKIDKLKKRLMDNNSVFINIKNYNYILTQNNLTKISEKILDKLKKLFEKIKYKDLTKIILVGGTSNLNLIKKYTEKFFNIKPLIDDNLQTIISKGSCLLSCYLSKKIKYDLTIIDIVKLSIGIETSDDNFSIIIPKGTIIPTKVSKKYIINDIDNLNIKIYQGNRLIANKNILLKTIILNKENTSINDIIQITICVDFNEMINIYIKNLNTNEKIETKIDKEHIKNYKIINDNTNDNEIYLNNKLKYEIKNIIKKYLNLIENNLEINNKNNIKKTLNNIIENLNNNSNNDLKKIKNKLFKKLGFEKI